MSARARITLGIGLLLAVFAMIIREINWLAVVLTLIGLNGASARLPDRFVLISASVVPQLLLNVPLSTTLLSNGLGLLVLLWYVTPRSYFDNIAIEVTPFRGAPNLRAIHSEPIC